MRNPYTQYTQGQWRHRGSYVRTLALVLVVIKRSSRYCSTEVSVSTPSTFDYVSRSLYVEARTAAFAAKRPSNSNRPTSALGKLRSFGAPAQISGPDHQSSVVRGRLSIAVIELTVTPSTVIRGRRAKFSAGWLLCSVSGLWSAAAFWQFNRSVWIASQRALVVASILPTGVVDIRVLSA